MQTARFATGAAVGLRAARNALLQCAAPACTPVFAAQVSSSPIFAKSNQSSALLQTFRKPCAMGLTPFVLLGQPDCGLLVS